MSEHHAALSGETVLTRLQKLAGVKLKEDEQLLVASRVHAAIYWKAVAVFIIALLLLIPAFNLGVFLMIVAAIMFGLAFMTCRILMVAATNYRVMIRSGFFYADVIELHYNQLETVELGATPIGQIFGYANLVITGAGQRRIMIPFMANALEIRQIINDQLVDRDTPSSTEK